MTADLVEFVFGLDELADLGLHLARDFAVPEDGVDPAAQTGRRLAHLANHVHLSKATQNNVTYICVHVHVHVHVHFVLTHVKTVNAFPCRINK